MSERGGAELMFSLFLFEASYATGEHRLEYQLFYINGFDTQCYELFINNKRNRIKN